MKLQDILFADIETVPQFENYQQLPAVDKELWDLKAKSIIRNPETETPESVYSQAGLYAEFGKIVSISCGIVQPNGVLKVQSFAGRNERKVLEGFVNMLNSWKNPNKTLCAHNGKDFDFPFLMRRLIIHGIAVPDVLNIAGKKPWEIKLEDTMELWKCGVFNYRVSIKLLAHVLGIPSPKDDIDGSEVGRVYWEEKNIQRIVTYCEKDVLTLALIYCRLKGYTAPVIQMPSAQTVAQVA